MPDSYRARPAVVRAKRNASDWWKVTHPDGRVEWLPDETFQRLYQPAGTHI